MEAQTQLASLQRQKQKLSERFADENATLHAEVQKLRGQVRSEEANLANVSSQLAASMKSAAVAIQSGKDEAASLKRNLTAARQQAETAQRELTLVKSKLAATTKQKNEFDKELAQNQT